MAMLPALNKDAIGRRFRRAGWSEGHAFTTDGKEWRYTSINTQSTYLTHGNQIEADWYEMDSYGIRIDDLTIRSEEEELKKANQIVTIEIKGTTVKDETLEAAKAFTDLEQRKKYTGELYGPDGKGKAILSFEKKSDAKQVLANPDNLGCYIVLRKEVAVYTTAVPVIKAKV